MLYLQHTTWGDFLGVLALFAFLVTVILLARAAMRPPIWMKPAWLKEEELRRAGRDRPGGDDE